MGKKLSTKEVIQRFKKFHGDNYDYSKFIYEGAHKKGIIICQNHGTFEMTYDNHIRGHACRKCKTEESKLRKEKRRNPNIKERKKNTNSQRAILSDAQVIKDFRKIHGDFYDYSLMKYKGSQVKIDIICPKHGIFQQSPNAHKRGDRCPFCAGIKYQRIDIIEKFRKVHGNRYDYSKVKYTGTKNKVIIICHIHGEFLQEPKNHIMGCGCPSCNAGGKEYKGMPREEVIKGFRKTHGDKYDYSEMEYINGYTKVKIICPIHGPFWQTPEGHKRGRGCNKCSVFGFKKKLPGILYYVRVEKDGQIAYKIGITNRSVKERFNCDIQYITILKEWYYENGKECFQEEQRILREFKYAKWKGKDLLRNGNSELFDRDVLLLDIN